MKEGLIVGSGDIAMALAEAGIYLTGKCFFASGVSNSREIRQEEFDRERNLLLDQDRELRLIYFGTLAMFYADTPYTKHKFEMEQLVKKAFPSYAILRLGTIVWGTNPNTIINHFKGQLDRGEPIEIQDTNRYVIDKPEFLHWVNLIPKWNVEMCLTGQPMLIKEIVKKYVL